MGIVFETASPLEKQQAIATEIEAEQELVDANQVLIERFDKKIQMR